ncbi:hypothetical protein ABZU25_07315 [Micromonospora sp. NPDC005215]|uniref:hypothetical protein n=1 Tax=Micromonospora sp. NPDC005215 TaxID=3157024 RepID=UPI0033AA6F9F
MKEPEEKAAERFDVRITDAGVEVYDGERWVPYRRVVADDPGPLIRDGSQQRETR